MNTPPDHFGREEPIDPDPLARYARQCVLPGIGDEGQRRLLGAHAVIVGLGALGCASADLLVRAGVGRVTLIDRDLVELTNLQRQTLFAEGDVGEPKANAAAARLRKVNSAVRIDAFILDLEASNAQHLARDLQIATPSTLLVDGTDNLSTRYLLNDLSVRHGVPFLYGGIVAARGMQATFVPPHGPCLRCVFPEPGELGEADTCDTAGVLGPAVAIVAAAQAADAIKILTGNGGLLGGTVLEFDLWSNARRRLELAAFARDKSSCPCCGQRRFEFLDGSRSTGPARLCGQNAVQVTPSRLPDAPPRVIDFAAVVRRLTPHAAIKRSPFFLKAALREEQLQLTIFADGRALVHGTTDAGRARAVYARYIGD